MNWTKRCRRPTWLEIGTQFTLGTMMLVLAVLDVTRYAEQAATHGDRLQTVGLAAVGGLLIGSVLELILQRARMREVVDPSQAPTA